MAINLTRAKAKELGIPWPETPKGRDTVSWLPRPAPKPYAGWPGRWELEIPGWTPTLDNALKRMPIQAHRLKKNDARTLAKAAIVFGVPAAFTRRRVTLELRNRYSTFPDDPAPLKSCLDACKTAGLIVNDSRKWCELVYPPTFLRGEKRTRIVLEDIE